MPEQVFSAADKAKAARREVSQRKRVYPRLIEQGRMSAPEADRQIAVMTQIAADYEAKAAEEALAQRLL